MENEDKKLRNFCKKGYLSGEDDDADGLIDEEQDNFLMSYITKFEVRKVGLNDELIKLQSLPKKKRAKHQMEIKALQTQLGNMEQHDYFLQQLKNNKDLIDDDKIDNICEDMDNFLINPKSENLRDELMQEYQQMLEDINFEIQEQHIEEQKAKIDHVHHSEPSEKSDPDRPKTRKELREERLKQEKLQKEEEKQKTKKVKEVKKVKEEKFDTVKFEDMEVGKLVDVVDYLSKWTNAIVVKVDKEKQYVGVVVDGDLEMEFTKDDIVG